MNQLDQATIDKLKADFGDDLRKIRVKGELVCVMRTPARGEWRRFSEQRSDDKRRLPAAEALVRHAVVWPAAAELEQLLDKRPGLLDVLSVKAAELAGATEEAAEEKL